MTAPEQLEWAAAHWRKLADEEEDRLRWDKHAIAQVVHARTASYREVANQLDAQREGRGRYVKTTNGWVFRYDEA